MYSLYLEHYIVLSIFVVIFSQVADLRYASPATVSRCGMVYVDPKNLGYNPYWQKWCCTRGSEKEREELNRLFEKYVPPCIDLILEGVVEGKQGKKLKQIIPLTNLNMVSCRDYAFKSRSSVHFAGCNVIYRIISKMLFIFYF